MKNLILVLAFAAALACIVESKLSETGYDVYEDLEELNFEDQAELNDIVNALEELESLRAHEETYRLFGDYADQAKDYYNDMKKDKTVKAVVKGAKYLYKNSPLEDAYNVYKGAKSGAKLATGNTNSYKGGLSPKNIVKNAKSLYKDNAVRDYYNVYKGAKSGLSLAKYG